MATKLYLIEQVGSGFVKIGISNEPEARVAQLQTGNPSALRLRVVVQCEQNTATKIERELHQRFKASQASGEWFYARPDEVLRVLRQRWDIVGITEAEYAPIPAPEWYKLPEKNPYALLLAVYLFLGVWLGVILYGAAAGHLSLLAHEIILYLVAFAACSGGVTHTAIAWYLFPPRSSKRGRARRMWEQNGHRRQ